MRRRAVTTQAKTKVTAVEYKELKTQYLSQISRLVAVHKIPSQLVINWDQMASIDAAPTINWTTAEHGTQRVEMAALNDQRQVTSTLVVTLNVKFLLFQTDHCHPNYMERQSFPTLGILFLLTSRRTVMNSHLQTSQTL